MCLITLTTCKFWDIFLLKYRLSSSENLLNEHIKSFLTMIDKSVDEYYRAYDDIDVA